MEYASWHWIFLINVPIGIIAMIVGVKFLPVIEKGNKAKLDIWGVILSPLAFSSLVFGVHRGGVDGWGDRITIISLAFSFIALALFIFVELRQKEPLLELRSFRSLEFSKGMILTWINQFALFGSILLIPIFLQQVRGFSSFESGLLVIPQALISFAGMIIGGKLFDKFGARPVVFSGLVLLSTGLFLLSRLQNDTSVYVMISYFAIMGLGKGLTTMQLGTHVLGYRSEGSDQPCYPTYCLCATNCGFLCCRYNVGLIDFQYSYTYESRESETTLSGYGCRIPRYVPSFIGLGAVWCGS